MANLNSTGSTRSSIGRSFSVSCSWRLIVCVEMTAFFFAATANRIAGIKYARLLPTPVPASTARCRPSINRRATATAISCCCGRYSKFFERDSTPAGEKISATCFTRSSGAPAGWVSTMLIMAPPEVINASAPPPPYLCRGGKDLPRDVKSRADAVPSPPLEKGSLGQAGQAVRLQFLDSFSAAVMVRWRRNYE